VSPARQAAVSAVLVAFIAASLLEIGLAREDWPLSSYPMFADVQERALRDEVVVGVVAGPEPREIPLRGKMVAPFSPRRLVLALHAIREQHGQAAVDRALGDCLVRYERGRGGGLHAGPPLAEMRLYAIEWAIDATDTPPARERQRTLLAVAYAPAVER
jgi:hypothetical protein